jgi:polysaccharide pyruvyl transferase WcaK-like protein
MTKPSFFYLLRTQYENMGDLVINRECIALLRERGNVLVNTDGVPMRFLEGLGLSSTEEEKNSRKFWQRILLSAFRRKTGTYLVLVPGAVIGGANFFQGVRHGLLALSYEFLRRIGVKTIRLGASLGPFTPLRSKLEAWKGRTMHFVGLRDSLSIEQARKLGIRSSKRFPDMALLLPTHASTKMHDRSCIVVSFRAHTSVVLPDLARQIEEVIDKIDPEQNAEIIFSAQVARDQPVMNEIFHLINCSRPKNIVSLIDDQPGLFSLYGRADVVISNRLHVLIFALSRGAQVRALVDPSHDRKIIGIFKEASLEDSLINLADKPLNSRTFIRSQPANIDVFRNAHHEARAILNDVLA